MYPLTILVLRNQSHRIAHNTKLFLRKSSARFMTHLGEKITQYSHMVLLLVNQCFAPVLELLPSHSEFTRQTRGHVVAIVIEHIQNTNDLLLDGKRRNGNCNPFKIFQTNIKTSYTPHHSTHRSSKEFRLTIIIKKHRIKNRLIA